MFLAHEFMACLREELQVIHDQLQNTNALAHRSSKDFLKNIPHRDWLRRVV